MDELNALKLTYGQRAPESCEYGMIYSDKVHRPKWS